MNGKAETKLLEWECDKCGKKITSLYERQFIQLIESHKLSHELKKMLIKGRKREKREFEES